MELTLAAAKGAASSSEVLSLSISGFTSLVDFFAYIETQPRHSIRVIKKTEHCNTKIVSDSEREDAKQRRIHRKEKLCE